MFIVYALWSGGVEKVLYELANGVVENQIDIRQQYNNKESE